MKRVLLTVLCMALLCGSASLVMAGPQYNTAVYALHVTAKYKNIGCLPTQNNPTQNTFIVAPCNYTVQWNTGIGPAPNRPYAWLVVAKAPEAEGIGGISCGVDWGMVQSDPGEAMQVAWTRCSDLEFPSGGWPAPGGGNRITWAAQTNCQRKQGDGTFCTTTAGFFYITSYYDYLIEAAYIRLTKNFNIVPAELKFADCAAMESDVDPLAAGWLGINANSSDIKVPGCNPCLGPCEEPVATNETTWGKVKTLYAR